QVSVRNPLVLQRHQRFHDFLWDTGLAEALKPARGDFEERSEHLASIVLCSVVLALLERGSDSRDRAVRGQFWRGNDPDLEPVSVLNGANVDPEVKVWIGGVVNDLAQIEANANRVVRNPCNVDAGAVVPPMRSPQRLRLVHQVADDSRKSLLELFAGHAKR